MTLNAFKNRLRAVNGVPSRIEVIAKTAVIRAAEVECVGAERGLPVGQVTCDESALDRFVYVSHIYGQGMVLG